MKQCLEINLPKPLGLTAQVLVREAARHIPEYFHPVATQIKGRDKDGREIEVNTVGRWMFGVPGYAGAARIVADGTRVLVYYPAESPGFIHDFMELLKHKMETEGAV